VHARNLSIVDEANDVGSTGIGMLLVSACSPQHAESFFDPRVDKTDMYPQGQLRAISIGPSKRLLIHVPHYDTAQP
jgi:hypothetical protein